jgi:hypothetical protein
MSSRIKEVSPARFPAGTIRQITQVLDLGEPRAEFIREAVMREIKRRAARNAKIPGGRRVIYERKASPRP